MTNRCKSFNFWFPRHEWILSNQRANTIFSLLEEESPWKPHYGKPILPSCLKGILFIVVLMKVYNVFCLLYLAFVQRSMEFPVLVLLYTSCRCWIYSEFFNPSSTTRCMFIFHAFVSSEWTGYNRWLVLLKWSLRKVNPLKIIKLQCIKKVFCSWYKNL